VQVRRSSDGATLDFYADRAGSLGTSLSGRGTPLTSWLNGATGYVSVWYDQSGAGHHATQTDSTRQPIIDTVNKLMDFTAQSGQAFFNLPSGTVPQQTSYTVTTKHGVINNNQGTWLYGGEAFDGVHAGTCNGFRRAGVKYYNYWCYDDTPAAGAYVQENTVTFQYDLSSRYLYVNGVSMGSWAASGWNWQAGNEYIGKCDVGLANLDTAPSAPQPIDGQLYFLHIFKNYLTPDDRAIVEGGVSPTGDCTHGRCVEQTQ
jgi:hypothetical protein